MLVAGRPLDTALFATVCQSSNQAFVPLVTGGSGELRLQAQGQTEVLSMSLQELLLLLGPPPVGLMEPRLLATMLRGVPLLTLMTDIEVEALAATMQPCSHEAGQVIMAEGEQGSGWHVLVDGEVLISQRLGKDEVEVPVCRLGRGQFFGERSVLRAEPVAASVTAVSACVTLRLRPEAFVEVLPPAVRSCMRQLKYLSDFRASAEVDGGALRPIAVVGKGSFGPVQLCKDTSSGATYVVKVMTRKVMSAHQQASAMNEVRLLRDIQHPFVVRMVASHKTAAFVSLIFEPLLGGDMFTHLTSQRTGMLPDADSAFYAACLAVALGHLHSHHVVYRDLKPENVMVCSDGYVKLIDFGYAKKLLHRTYSVVGTVEYLAPEVILQRGHMFGADWWSLGIMVYEMLCGFTPYTDHGNLINEMEICRNITSPEGTIPFPPWLQPETREFVLRLLTRNPVERLGCGGGGVRDVMGAEVFKGIDFSALVCKSLPPPFLPRIASDEDVSHFEENTGPDFGDFTLIDIAADAPYVERPGAWDYYF